MVSCRVKLLALALALVGLLPSCTPSKYEFESNKQLGVYLKVPKTWTKLSQDELFPLYAQGEKQPSEEAFQILKQVMWERAWDSSPKPSVSHFLLGEADAPVVRVSVRALTPDQRDLVSTDALKNLTLGAYSENLEGFKELLRNPGTSDLVSADFIPLQEQELTPKGYFGVRQLFEARNSEDQSLYVIGFIGLVDDARTRLYTLTTHCNRRCYVANEAAIQKVLDSFTVRKP
jgi:hypothetical protein